MKSTHLDGACTKLYAICKGGKGRAHADNSTLSKVTLAQSTCHVASCMHV